jgi:alpha-1,2-mannosyltransferase
VACCRTPLAPRRNWRLAAEFSLVALGMLLFSERTWKHHCVTILLPFAVFTYYLAVIRPGPILRSYLIATLLASFVLMTATSTTGLLPRIDEMARMAQVYGAYVWAYLLLIAGLIVTLISKSRTSNFELRTSTEVRSSKLEAPSCAADF